jgi:hypothetical protein
MLWLVNPQCQTRNLSLLTPKCKPEWTDFNDEQMTRFQQELGRGQQFPLPEDLGASWVSGADLNAGDVRGCAE